MAKTSDDERTREFLRLLGVHEQRLGAYIFSLMPHAADAQDIAQEVRLRLWDQFDQYDPGKDFGAWARTIAYYMVLANREQKARRAQTTLVPDFLEAVSEEFEQADELLERRRQALELCLKQLAEPSRRLLMRYYGGQESLRQIAQQSGRSYAATRKAVQRMRDVLSGCIDEQVTEEAP